MIGCQNSKFCYIEREKPNVNKIKSPYDSMGKKLHGWSTLLLQSQKLRVTSSPSWYKEGIT